jgi:hypothetical protein
MTTDPEKYYAEFLERIRTDPALQKLVATYQAKKNASKINPANMARDPKMCRRAAKKRWAAVKSKRKQEERAAVNVAPDNCQH